MRTLLLLNVFAPEELGHRIRSARDEAGLTQDELSDLLDLSMRQVQNLESGVSKPYKHIKRIAEATGKSVEWLLHGDPELPHDLRAELAEAVEALAEVAPRLASVADRLEALLSAQPPARAARKPRQSG